MNTNWRFSSGIKTETYLGGRALGLGGFMVHHQKCSRATIFIRRARGVESPKLGTKFFKLRAKLARELRSPRASNNFVNFNASFVAS